MTIEELQAIDNKINTLNISYKGFDLTYIIRNSIISKIRTRDNKGNSEIKLNFEILFRLLSSAIMTCLSLFGKEKIWIFSNAERRKIIGEYFEDRVASIVSEKYDSTLFIENPAISEHKKPSKDKILSDSIFYFISFILGLFVFKQKHLKIIGQVAELEKLFGVKIEIDSKIRRYLGQYYAMKFFLKIRRPDLVYMVYPDGYSGYIRAFKERNISVIELQHGVIYATHPSYNCYLDRDLFLFRPDYILTYGAADKNLLRDVNYLNAEYIYPIGSYALWLYKYKQNNVSEYLQSVLLSVGLNRKIVLISATVKDLDVLVNLAMSVDDDRFHFLILPRITSSVVYPNSNNVTVLDVNLTNIYELLKKCDSHITMSSTTALEALYFNKQSIVFEPIEGTAFFRKNYPYIKSFEYVSDKFHLIKRLELHTIEQDDSVNILFEEKVDEKFNFFVNKVINV